MRIAHIITRMDWGGSPDIVRLLFQGLEARGAQCTLITGPTDYPGVRTREFLERIHARLLVVEELQRQPQGYKDIVACRKLTRLLRQGEFDIVHTHTAKAGALGRISARLAGVKHVVHSPHGHNFYGYFNFVFSRCIAVTERALAPLAEVLVVQTQLEKEDYICYAGVDPGRIRVIPQGIEPAPGSPDIPAIRRSLGIPAGNQVVGTVSRLEPVKGIQFLILAAGRLVRTRPQVSFVVAGDGSQAELLRAMVSRDNLGAYFIFTGWREDARQLMPAFDLLVQPSLNESVGMVLLEAQAAGVPVIATRVGGIPETIDEGHTGLLVAPADAQGLALSMQELLADPVRRAAMAAQARSRVGQHFLVSRMIESHAQLYGDLLR